MMGAGSLHCRDGEESVAVRSDTGGNPVPPGCATVVEVERHLTIGMRPPRRPAGPGDQPGPAKGHDGPTVSLDSGNGRYRGLGLALVFAASGPLLAQSSSAEGLRPLDDTVTDRTETSYPIIRCAAFYNSLIEWAGQQLDEQTFDVSKSAAESLLFVGVLLRSGKSADSIEHLSEVVMQDTSQITDLYLENFRRSYAATGNAWEGNSVWERDLETCEPIAQEAILVASEREGE